jgi:YegS/Rv2252/BmrU family lipid kinase
VPRAAVIVHPLKHDDLDAFRTAVCQVMADRGWAEPLWLETSAGETGQLLVEEAIRAAVRVVVASGGDGTVTACVAGLAGTGIPLGVLPAGTGNLLARNLGLPLSLDDALAVALTGTDRRLDIGVANGRPFAVMAGIGFDAQMLDGASEQMKERMGWVAYVVSAMRHFGERPMRVVVRADNATARRCRASGVIIGNVGSLPGRVRLLPDAEPDDGLLDVALLTARGWTGWLKLALDLLLRRRTGHLHSLTCRDLLVDLDRERPWEVDGEVVGPTLQLRVSVQPGCLLVRVPSPAGI